MNETADDVFEAAAEKPAFLDTIGARVLAIVIAAIAGFLLITSHQHYSGSSGGMLGGVDKAAFEACIDTRMAAFEKLAGQAGFDEARRAVAEDAARASADVVCAEQTRPDKP